MAFANPEKNLSQIEITSGMRVADIGAGAGVYTLLLSKRVGDKGRVYAIDVQKELLERLRMEGKRLHINNIDTVWADAERLGATKLRDNSVEAVVLSNILFQVEDKNGMLEEARRILVPGGQLLFIDWSDSFGGLGPQPEDVLTKEKARSLVLGSGFMQLKEFDAGDHHYGFIFAKQ